MDLQQRFNTRQSRRSVLRQLGTLAGVSLTLDACSGNTFVPPRPGPTATGNLNSIKHVLLACQENRSFDTYFGYYPKAGPFGVPLGYTQPNGHGGKVSPYHFHSPSLHDIAHSWQPIHREWDNGAMDGFYMTNGSSAIGYYDGTDIRYYYALATAFTLCGNYFSYQLGPTYPNRIALCSGTSGGHTTNTIKGGSLNWPTIVDLLDQYHVSWKCYNLGRGTGSEINVLAGFNGLAFFSKWQHDPRLYYKEADYYHDLKSGTLPQVSFLITEFPISTTVALV